MTTKATETTTMPTDAAERLADVEGRMAGMIGAAHALTLLASHDRNEDDPQARGKFRLAVEWIGDALDRELNAAMDVTCGDKPPRRRPPIVVEDGGAA
jgi:hypothetical protein